MKPNRFSAVSAICIGALMTAMWVFFLTAGQVPELQSRPVEIVLHLVAEFATGAMLVASGIAALRWSRTGNLVLIAALGMLLYTLIVSPGYYVQRQQWPFVAMFGALLVISVVALVLQVRSVAAKE
jgi:hypothetical protein